MKYLNKFFYTIFLLLLLNSCSSWSDFKKTMSGEKVTTTDEFLIKKKDPLALPPDYEKLPLPENNSKKTKNSSIEMVIGSNEDQSDKSKKTSSLENLILKELRKNK